MPVILQAVIVAGLFLLAYSFLASLNDYEWNRKTKKFENWKDKWM